MSDFLTNMCRPPGSSITARACGSFFFFFFFFFLENKADEFKHPVRLEHLRVDIPASRNSWIHLRFVHIVICTTIIKPMMT